MPGQPRAPRWFFLHGFSGEIAVNGSRLANSFTAVRGFILTYRIYADLRYSGRRIC